MSDITLSETAHEIIVTLVARHEGDRVLYAEYVADQNLTCKADVSDHVAIFKAAYVAAVPNADKSEVKNFCNKIRNGLTRNLPDTESDDTESDDTESDDTESDDTESDDTESSTDWAALLRIAVKNAAEHGMTADEIAATVQSTLA